ADLLRHEHAPLALAQRCSGVMAPMPLFTALLNYRYSQGGGRTSEENIPVAEGVELQRTEERTNYPFVLSVDDMGQGFQLVAQTPGWVGPSRVCRFMQTALRSMVTALEREPSLPMRRLAVIPEEEQEQVLYGWNDTDMELQEKPLYELFEEQV